MKKTTIVCVFFIILFILNNVPMSTSIEISKIQKNSTVHIEPDYWAVIVSTNVTNITFIYNSLIQTNNWNESHITLLNGQNATRDNILEALDWLKTKSNDNDIVLFSHNGHGNHVEERYGIVPWDRNIIFTDELDEKFDAITCKQMCLIFDCCYSGSFIEGRPTVLNQENNMMFQKTFSKGLDKPGRVIMMSTMKRGTGIFAAIQVGNNTIAFDFIRFFTEGIDMGVDNNQDGWISAEEAYHYGRKKYLPFAILLFFSPITQIASLISSGSFALPFPTLYDGVEGELLLAQK